MKEETIEQYIFAFPIKFDSRLDLMKKAVAIFATLERVRTGEVKIRRKLEEVLSFYALNGYSPETKNMIIETMGISSDNLTQINAELTKNGYLIRDNNNFRKKYLHPDILRLKNTLTSPIIDKKKAIVIGFNE